MGFQNKKHNASGRVRNFSLISYLNEEQILSVLDKHKSQIRNYAYILHDKDTFIDTNGVEQLKEVHYHIIIITFNTCTVSAIRRWFFGFVDSEHKDINTLGQVCDDIFERYDYFTHNKDETKHQYSFDDIRCLDRSYFEGGLSADVDVSAEMLFDLVRGVSYRILAKRYGKNFIYHYSALRVLAYDMIREERAFGNVDLLPQCRSIDKDY